MKKLLLIVLNILIAILIFSICFWFFKSRESVLGSIPLSKITIKNPEAAAVENSISKSPELSQEQIDAQAGYSTYIEITDSCAHNFGGECLRVHSEPSLEAPSVARLRTGVVLKVSEKIENEGMIWYKVVFDEYLRYAGRVTSDWYVVGDYVREFKDIGTVELTKDTPATNKRILVNRTQQKLYAFEGDSLFMEESISTGLLNTPTPRGTFTIYKKMPSRYMQGPIPGISKNYYDLPGVPWNLYFTSGGAVVHGAYWHEDFGSKHSNGCVNMPLEQARILYEWADLGTPISVVD